MSKSPIKQMLEAELDSFSVKHTEVSGLRKDTAAGTHWLEGPVEFPDGRVVHCYSEWHEHTDAPRVALSMYASGRFYQYHNTSFVGTRESMRRLAVAFADRVAKEAKDGR